MTGRAARLRDERGVMLYVFFSIVLTLLLFLGSVVVTIGSWYTHGRHLQTKVDAAAFAGGQSWNFPCDADVDAAASRTSRDSTSALAKKADGLPYTGSTTYNPQVGHVQQGPDPRRPERNRGGVPKAGSSGR